MADDLLTVENVRKEFGGLIAVSDLDFTIPVGSIVSLIGPNGAGKTTFFNMLTGVYKPTSGQVVFDGTDVTGKPPHAITKLGIGRTFQNIRLFPQMTALENVLVGMHSRLKGGILGSIFGTPGVRREERDAHEKVARSCAMRAWAVLMTSSRRISPTETSAAWSSRVRSRPSRSFFFSTSPRPE
jgi:branched-chain amino acid transport system ATP-binding protein